MILVEVFPKLIIRLEDPYRVTGIIVETTVLDK